MQGKRRRGAQRGWAGHPAVAGLPVCTADGVFSGPYHPARTHDECHNSLSNKGNWPRSGTAGWPCVHVVVRRGFQVSADWHMPLRLTARSDLTSRDGTGAEHSLAVRQCRGGSRAAREGSMPPVQAQPPSSCPLSPVPRLSPHGSLRRSPPPSCNACPAPARVAQPRALPGWGPQRRRGCARAWCGTVLSFHRPSPCKNAD